MYNKKSTVLNFIQRIKNPNALNNIFQCIEQLSKHWTNVNALLVIQRIEQKSYYTLKPFFLSCFFLSFVPFFLSVDPLPFVPK